LFASVFLSNGPQLVWSVSFRLPPSGSLVACFVPFFPRLQTSTVFHHPQFGFEPYPCCQGFGLLFPLSESRLYLCFQWQGQVLFGPWASVLVQYYDYGLIVLVVFPPPNHPISLVSFLLDKDCSSQLTPPPLELGLEPLPKSCLRFFPSRYFPSPANPGRFQNTRVKPSLLARP